MEVRIRTSIGSRRRTHPDRVSEYSSAGLPIVHRGGRGRGPSQNDAIACAE